MKTEEKKENKHKFFVPVILPSWSIRKSNFNSVIKICQDILKKYDQRNQRKRLVVKK